MKTARQLVRRAARSLVNTYDESLKTAKDNEVVT